MLTTSRKPSQNLKNFLKYLLGIFGISRIVKRNNLFLHRLINKCLTLKFSDIMIVYEKRTHPNILIICHLPKGPSIFFGLNVPESYKIFSTIKYSSKNPYIVFDNLTTEIGKKIKNFLRLLFPNPNHYTKRLLSFSGREKEIIVSNFLVYHNGLCDKKISLKPICPDFRLLPIKISLGIIDNLENQIEWKINKFHRNFTKRSFF